MKKKSSRELTGPFYHVRREEPFIKQELGFH
jgi:hypothetical protein